MIRVARHAGLVALLFFVLLQGGFTAYLLAGGRPSAGAPSVDFATYYLAAKAMLQGEEVYDFTDADWQRLAAASDVADFAPPYRYPPLTAALITPLTRLPFPSGLAIWSVLSIVGLLVAGLALSRLGGVQLDPAVFVAIGAYLPALTTLYTGQVNDLVVLGVALYVLLARDRAYLAGAILGVSLMLKPIGAPLVAHLAWRRDLRALAGVAIGLAASLAASLAIVGPRSHAQYLGAAWSLSTLAPEAPVTYPTNQSLLGALGRTAEAAGLDPEFARSLWLAASLVLVILIAMLTQRRRGERADAFDLQTGLVLLAINLLAPVSWYHHLTIAAISLVVAWRVATPRLRGWLLLAFGLIELHGLFWHRLEGATVLLSLATYGLLVAFAVTAVLLMRELHRHAVM